MQPTLGPSGIPFIAKPMGGLPPGSPAPTGALPKPGVSVDSTPSPRTKAAFDVAQAKAGGGGGSPSIGAPAAVGAKFVEGVGAKPGAVIEERAGVLCDLAVSGAEFAEGRSALPASPGLRQVVTLPDTPFGRKPTEISKASTLRQTLASGFSKDAGLRRHIENTLEILGLKAEGLAPRTLAQERLQGFVGTRSNGHEDINTTGHTICSPLQSIQRLCQDTRLTSENKQMILAQLKIISSKLPEEMSLEDRQTFLSGVLQDITQPESIRQHGTPSCTGAVCQMYLAMTQPTKYLDVMIDLCKTGKSVLNPKRQKFEMEVSFALVGTLALDKTGRSLSSQIMQDALINFSNDGEFDIKNKSTSMKDKRVAWTLSMWDQPDREYAFEARGSAGQAFFNRPSTTTASEASVLRNAALKEGSTRLQSIQAQLEQGCLVPFSFDIGSGAHSVLITHVEGPDLCFINPWGKMQKFSGEDALLMVSNGAYSLTTPKSGSLPIPTPLKDARRYNDFLLTR